MKSTQEITQEVRELGQWIPALRQQVGHVVIGQKYLVDRLLLGLLANGHLLLEGVPGLAKTLTVKTMAATIQTGFQRLQFTPDLLPADLIGTLIYNPRTGEFTTKLGPIFSNLILADEINRAPAKVQSALLEAMQERQVTIGEQTYPLPDPFLVLATQNPIEQEGTYQLPEAQLDRFMLKLNIGYPQKREERTILDLMATSAPDLLPADLIGTLIYNPRTGEFTTKLGPIFSNLILADEINRAPAKVQSALLEAMQERQVTIGEQTYPLPDPFLVLATQNPIEQEGTYQLPEAQLDRFMFKLNIGYPQKREERSILDLMATSAPDLRVDPVVDPKQIITARDVVNNIYIDDRVKDYIVDVVWATREPSAYNLRLEGLIRYGASPRATSLIISTSTIA